jgi:radical SAM superfamily enzyme YgiQ (UPF0313 family)
MKVNLVRPSIMFPRNNITTFLVPSLGVAYVAGSIRDAGFEIKVIDAVGESLTTRYPIDNDCFLYGLSTKDTIDLIDHDVDIIGIHAGFSFEWPYCRTLIKGIRERYPEAVLVAGGEHISAMPDSLSETDIDIGVLGEGEETILEIIQAYDTKDDLGHISGIAYKSGDGSVKVNPRRDRIKKIDDIPWPAWDLMPINNYLDSGQTWGVNRGRSMPVMASRGCPYQCTFCSSPQMWTTRWTARKPDLLLDEFEYYQSKYNATNFDFYDLTAIVKKSWIIEFCELIEKRGLSFTWQLPSGTRSEAIDREVANYLYKSGCRNLCFAPESGSKATLKRIKKKIDPEKMLNAIKGCNAEKINVKCNTMIGYPGETIREVLQTYRYIFRMALAGVYDVTVWVFSPYPGSELFDDLVKDGKVDVKDKNYFNSLRSYADPGQVVSYSENMSDNLIKKLRLVGLTLFYVVQWTVRPIRPAKIIWNLLKGKQESKSEQAIGNMLRNKRAMQTRLNEEEHFV